MYSFRMVQVYGRQGLAIRDFVMNVYRIVRLTCFLCLTGITLISCRWTPFGFLYSLGYYYEVTPHDLSDSSQEDELLLIAHRILEAERYDCYSYVVNNFTSYQCWHPSNRLHVHYNVENGVLAYRVGTNVPGVSIATEEQRLNSGAKALVDRFEAANMNVVQIVQ